MSLTNSRAGHVAVWPWSVSSSSHALPLFQVVHRLANAAPEVLFSFFATPKSNNHIYSTVRSKDVPTNIKFYNIEDGLPAEADHSTLNNDEESTHFREQFPNNIKHAMDAAMEEETDLGGGRRFTCLITDGLLSKFAVKMAEDMNVPWIAFWSPAPHDFPVYFQIDLVKQLYAKAKSDDQDHPQDQIIDIIPGLPPVCFKNLPFFDPLVGIDDWASEQNLHILMAQASALVMNSYEEINPPLLINYLKSKYQNLLFLSCSTLSIVPTSGSHGCLSWLDKQEAASVVYISFGTVVDLGCEELVALAEALEASGVPFLWSLRENLKNCLPNGFLERIGKEGNGKVVAWAPQRQVLEHPSIGVFVNNCGYNSVLESISQGVPLICRPLWVDNHLNAVMVEKVWGIGVKVEGGVITKDGMLECLEIIFQREKGKEIREASSALKDVLLKAAGPDGIAAKHFNSLLQIISQEDK